MLRDINRYQCSVDLQGRVAAFHSVRRSRDRRLLPAFCLSGSAGAVLAADEDAVVRYGPPRETSELPSIVYCLIVRAVATASSGECWVYGWQRVQHSTDHRTCPFAGSSANRWRPMRNSCSHCASDSLSNRAFASLVHPTWSLLQSGVRAIRNSCCGLRCSVLCYHFSVRSLSVFKASFHTGFYTLYSFRYRY